jgi:hypothetical protein
MLHLTHHLPDTASSNPIYIVCRQIYNSVFLGLLASPFFLGRSQGRNVLWFSDFNPIFEHLYTGEWIGSFV